MNSHLQAACSTLLFALLLGGCALGPDYHPPQIQSPAQFRGGPETPAAESLADLPWWNVYQDPELAGLIRVALTNNFDWKIAVTRVEQSRQLAWQARAQFLPTVDYKGEISRGKNEFLGSPSPGRPQGDAVLTAASVFWEVDLWGRIRRLDESARAQYFASEENRRGIALTIVSDVAQKYFELLALDLQMEIAQRTTNSFGETLRIFQMRLAHGLASQLEVARAQAALTASGASVPELERQIALKENEINILLGRPPGPVQRGKKLLEQRMSSDVPAGLPSALLERRPDIRQAGQMLRSANANIGVAEANFLPQIGLTTLAGRVSPALSSFTAGGANVWSLAASASGPIFQGGALRARYRQSLAAREEARDDYEQVALNALHEVAAALISREKLEAVRLQQTDSVTAYRQAVTVAMQRYLAGAAKYDDVLDAQQELFPEENALAQTELNQLIVVVQLYKALGGGWQATLEGR